MTTIANIEALLNIQIGERKLRDGKRKTNKNQYYWLEDQWYIIKLSKGLWMIAEDCRKTRQLLRDYTWCVNSGYAYTSGVGKLWHQVFLNYDDELVADHINNKKYDNRNDNLRVVTPSTNSRNRSKQCTNTSGKQGVYHSVTGGRHYWKVDILDNNREKVIKLFSIAKLGDDEAKRLAIEKRKELEVAFGYIGD